MKLEIAKPEYNLSTYALAQIAQVKPESIRVHLCRTGTYFGLIPKKLPNGRLTWPSNSRELLLAAAENHNADVA